MNNEAVCTRLHKQHESMKAAASTNNQTAMIHIGRDIILIRKKWRARRTRLQFTIEVQSGTRQDSNMASGQARQST